MWNASFFRHSVCHSDQRRGYSLLVSPLLHLYRIAKLPSQRLCEPALPEQESLSMMQDRVPYPIFLPLLRQLCRGWLPCFNGGYNSALVLPLLGYSCYDPLRELFMWTTPSAVLHNDGYRRLMSVIVVSDSCANFYVAGTAIITFIYRYLVTQRMQPLSHLLQNLYRSCVLVVGDIVASSSTIFCWQWSVLDVG